MRALLESPAARRLAATLVLSAAGVTTLVHFEGSVPTAYLDAVGVPTVCVGHTATVTRADIGKDFSPLCDQLLAQDSQDAQDAVQALVTEPVTQGQYDALVSFTFNVGRGNLASSTLLRKLNAGDCLGAAAEFPRWNRAKGRVLSGLTKRRLAEQAMFAAGCPSGVRP